MRWNCRLVLFALLVLFPACNGGDLAVNPSPDQKAPDGVVADGAGEIVIADVPLPDVIPDMVADTPVDPDVWEVVPACEVGDGCFGDL